jgi:hypothetical protein
MRRDLGTLLSAGLFPILLAGCPGNNNNNDPEDCFVAGDEDQNGQSDCDDAACAEVIDCEPVADGFDNPESVFFDAGTDAFYVSNTGNFQGFTAGDGFISKIDAATGEITLNFTAGLDSPTGLRANGNNLFVADGTNIRVIDITNGTLVNTIDVAAVVAGGFINDLAVDPANGDLYASDTFGQAIIRVPGGNGVPEVFVQDVALEGPNGLLVDGTNLLVASLGPDLQPDFTTSAPGAVQVIDLNDPNLAIVPVSQRIGGLDGVEIDGASLLVTDFAGRLFEINPAADPSEILLIDGTADIFAAAAADFGFDPARRIVAVPQLFGTTVTFIDLDNL